MQHKRLKNRDHDDAKNKRNKKTAFQGDTEREVKVKWPNIYSIT